MHQSEKIKIKLITIINKDEYSWLILMYARNLTKLKVYKAVVLPTLLYVCETRTVYQRHAKRLNHFHTNCLRKLLKIKRQDRIPDTDVLKEQGCRVYILFWNWHSKDGQAMLLGCLRNVCQKNPLWRTRNGQTLPWWSEEAIQIHPQSLPQGFQHTNRVMGTNCTGPSKVASLTRRC